jgi:hypothetical protein
LQGQHAIESRSLRDAEAELRGERAALDPRCLTADKR